MSTFQDKFKEQNYYTRLINFQQSQPVPLIENNYHILPESYLYTLGSYTYNLYPPALQDFPKDAVKAYREITSPLDTAAFNLATYFGQDPNNKFLRQNNIPTLLGEFKDLTGKNISFAHHSHPDQESLLLICYPGRVEKSGWSPTYDHQENKTKAQFFAFLWDRKFITEEQLFQSNAMLGAQAQNIIAFKKRLEKTGRFNPLASPTSSRPATP